MLMMTVNSHPEYYFMCQFLSFNLPIYFYYDYKMIFENYEKQTIFWSVGGKGPNRNYFS